MDGFWKMNKRNGNDSLGIVSVNGTRHIDNTVSHRIASRYRLYSCPMRFSSITGKIQISQSQQKQGELFG